MPGTKIQEFTFLATLVLVTVAFLWLLSPYYGAILWAVILAILFDPLQRGLERWLGGRRNLAAALSVLACICVVVIPGTLILAALANEAASLYTRIGTREFDPGTMLAQLQGVLPSFVWRALAALDLGDMAQLQTRLTSFLLEFSQTLANRAIIIGQNTAQFVISLGVMLYLLFFLFRDGVALAARIRKASPLGARETDQLLEKFTSVVKATVKGNVTIAAIQGAIGGVTFGMLGIQAALLWGVLMAVLSLLPAVGAGLVWVPAAAYLLLTGAYLKGAILLAIGTLVISTVDNVLRPALVGKGTMLPDYAVLISTVGGLSLIGMNGFVLGPLIVALFVAAWSLFSDDKMQPS
ncbi:AI-2E family transporter [Xanthobacter autotrophicus]|uniref:AI-2E family transporter n=1 Tax=Xanthobacter autotrophicus TaxID=280 RepID=UPI003726CFAE